MMLSDVRDYVESLGISENAPSGENQGFFQSCSTSLIF